MPARTRKILHDDETRSRIQASNIITRLHKLIQGEIEMPAHAVTAALGLLRKVLPDVTSVEHSGEVTTRYVVGVPSRINDSIQWAQQQEPTIQ
jgi:hypothetical protein